MVRMLCITLKNGNPLFQSSIGTYGTFKHRYIYSKKNRNSCGEICGIQLCICYKKKMIGTVVVQLDMSLCLCIHCLCLLFHFLCDPEPSQLDLAKMRQCIDLRQCSDLREGDWTPVSTTKYWTYCLSELYRYKFQSLRWWFLQATLPVYRPVDRHYFYVYICW